MKAVVIFTVGMLCLPARLPGQARLDAEEHRPISPLDASENVVAAPTVPNAAALPTRVTLTGIANLNYKCALLTIQTAGQSKISVVLKEGETEAAVQVLQINMTNTRVLIRNADTTQLLSLAGLEVPTTPAPDAEHLPLLTIASEEAGER